MRCLVGCVALIAGCGSVNDPAVGDAGVPGDAPVTAPRCDPSKPFGDETPINGFGSFDYQQSISLLANERTAYVVLANRVAGTTGDPDFDIYKATRAGDSGDFGTPTRVAFDTTAPEADVTISGDGKLMVMRKPGTNGYADLYESDIEADGSFKTVQRINEISDPNLDDLYPTLAVDGSALYFTRYIDSVEQSNIFVSTRSNGKFATPSLIAGTNVEVPVNGVKSAENGTVMSPDQKQVIFSRGDNMWIGIRTNTTEDFAIKELHDANDAQMYGQASWMPSDGCRLYYARAEYGANNEVVSDRIFVRSRPL